MRGFNMNGIDYTNDPRAVLIHFNPNHDKLGRFANSRFGGSRVSKPIDKNSDKGYNKKEQSNDSSNAGKFVKIGATVAISALAAYGGYTLYKSGVLDNYIDSGRSMLNNVLGKTQTRTASNFGPEVTPHFTGISDWNISDFTKSLQGSFAQMNSQPVKPATEAVKGLKKLAKPESIKEAALNSNPNRGNNKYKNNCTVSAITGIMRTLGWDITAPHTNGQMQNLNGVVEDCFSFENENIRRSHVKDWTAAKFGKSPKAASEVLLRAFGPNASGVCSIEWKYGGGHAFAWIIKDGNVSFFCPQKGFDDTTCKARFWNGDIDINGALQLARIDDLPINLEGFKKWFG